MAWSFVDTVVYNFFFILVTLYVYLISSCKLFYLIPFHIWGRDVAWELNYCDATVRLNLRTLSQLLTIFSIMTKLTITK